MLFQPIRTERLVIRAMGTDDVADLAARRNDPRAAEFQSWVLPFPTERAQSMVEAIVAMEGPANDEWWMAAITDLATGATIGDLALYLSSDANTAEVGYTLASQYWGNGYATEAVEAFVPYLFQDLGVTRVEAKVHPDNVPSIRVLERTGFLFEGHTRSSYWLQGEVSDDLWYAMLRDDWDTWRNRPQTPPAEVRLVEVTPANVRQVRQGMTHNSQERFVSPTVNSLADALIPEIIDGAPVVPWYRGIEADGELVGFVMMALRTEHHPEPFLWRFLIDRMHQRRRIGSAVLDLLETECLSMGDDTLLVSWGEGIGSPGPFYLSRGFVPTGQVLEGEIEARKRLV